ncbi:MAG: DUF420 domain-containing protein [Phycisphaerae bacterium]|nr:DUF420 domain-containing protein [Phycisphaerae bacterium]
MIEVRDLPAIDAGLNGLSGILLTAGYVCIRRRRIAAHRAFMISAVVTSAVFLACYVTYHAHRTYVTGLGPTRFGGAGWTRPVYFSILISHTILAAVCLPLAIVTVVRGLRGRFEQHARIARWTFPIWLYVSVTGVLVYLMLYHWFGPPAG